MSKSCANVGGAGDFGEGGMREQGVAKGKGREIMQGQEARWRVQGGRVGWGLGVGVRRVGRQGKSEAYGSAEKCAMAGK